uniref:Uncharacterized protein n=1 Tax=Megaselia scalaris TaxID=36166 RepID=T1GMF4_MEGSC
MPSFQILMKISKDLWFGLD